MALYPKDYYLVRAYGPRALERKVVARLALGWELQGGITTVVEPDGRTLYTQAVFREGQNWRPD